MVHVYLTELIIFEVSLVDAAESFLLSKELPLLHATNIDAATSINPIIDFFMLLIFEMNFMYRKLRNFYDVLLAAPLYVQCNAERCKHK